MIASAHVQGRYRRRKVTNKDNFNLFQDKKWIQAFI